MRLDLASGGRRKAFRPGPRVTFFGVLGLILFGILFFRLWSLQVITGDRYLAEANENRTREVRMPAPRGRILDRDGQVLVDNRINVALQLDPLEIPTDRAERRQLFRRVGKLLGRDRGWVARRYRDELREGPPGSPIILSRNAPDELAWYLKEHQSEYPEVQVNRTFVRRYPRGSTAAHLLGSVGEVNAEDLESSRGVGLLPGDTLGRSGIEEYYDQTLRGVPGTTRLQVNSAGQIRGRLPSLDPEPGDAVRLTLDTKVQEAGEAALGSTGLPGAFVALDVTSGEVLALGSSPSFDPAEFTRPLSQKRSEELWDEDNGAPLFNRAIAGAYPVGSVYKPITALAGLDAGVITPATVIQDNGVIEIAGQTFTNAGSNPMGPVDLRRSLEVSSDIYYYLLGRDLNRGDRLQHWSRQLGIGEPTGIDLPGEAAGLLPDREWRDQLFAEGNTDRGWVVGDNIQLAIGQGDLQAAPLQMALAYAIIGNNGRVIRPHLLARTEDVAGRVLTEPRPGIDRTVKLDQTARRIILEGLHDAAQAPEGTSFGTFRDFPVKLAGKTGTAQRPPHGDQAWFAALAPWPDPTVAVAVTVEQGGFGADTAAPVARRILEQLFRSQIAAARKREQPAP